MHVWYLYCYIDPWNYHVRVEKSYFVITPEIAGIYIWRKNPLKYIKFQSATNCINSQFHLNSFFLSYLTGITCNLNDKFMTCMVITGFLIFGILYMQSSKLVDNNIFWQKIKRKSLYYVPRQCAFLRWYCSISCMQCFGAFSCAKFSRARKSTFRESVNLLLKFGPQI